MHSSSLSVLNNISDFHVSSLPVNETKQRKLSIFSPGPMCGLVLSITITVLFLVGLCIVCLRRKYKKNDENRRIGVESNRHPTAYDPLYFDAINDHQNSLLYSVNAINRFDTVFSSLNFRNQATHVALLPLKQKTLFADIGSKFATLYCIVNHFGYRRHNSSSIYPALKGQHIINYKYVEKPQTLVFVEEEKEGFSVGVKSTFSELEIERKIRLTSSNSCYVEGKTHHSENLDPCDKISEISQDSLENLNSIGSFSTVDDFSIKVTSPLLPRKRRFQHSTATNLIRNPHRCLEKDYFQKSHKLRSSYWRKKSKSFSRINFFLSEGVTNIDGAPDALAFKLAEMESTDSDYFLRTLESDSLCSHSNSLSLPLSLSDTKPTSMKKVHFSCQTLSEDLLNGVVRISKNSHIYTLNHSLTPVSEAASVVAKSHIVTNSPVLEFSTSRFPYSKSVTSEFPSPSPSVIVPGTFSTSTTHCSPMDNLLDISSHLSSIHKSENHRNVKLGKRNRKVHFHDDKKKAIKFNAFSLETTSITEGK